MPEGHLGKPRLSATRTKGCVLKMHVIESAGRKIAQLRERGNESIEFMGVRETDIDTEERRRTEEFRIGANDWRECVHLGHDTIARRR